MVEPRFHSPLPNKRSARIDGATLRVLLLPAGWLVRTVGTDGLRKTRGEAKALADSVPVEGRKGAQGIW